MQTSQYSVDQSPRPWVEPHVYVDYSPTDSARIEAGVRAMLTEPGAKKAILIPLTPLSNGVQIYTAAVRCLSDRRCVNMVQYQFLPFTATRAIETPKTIRDAFPHFRFTAEPLGVQDNQRLLLVMQTSQYSVDQSARPWVEPHVYVDFSQVDSARIEAGVRAMLTEPGAKKAILIPLTPLTNGVQIYAAAVRCLRNERCVNMVQYQFLPITATRAVETPETIRAAFPHIRFTAEPLGVQDHRRLLLDVHRELSGLVYDTISLFNPQHTVVGGMRLGFDVRINGWNLPVAEVYCHMYEMAMASRMEIALREVCGGVRTVLLVYNPETHHFAAILRNGTAINIVDVQVIPEIVNLQRMVVFQPRMALMFPGFQFTSTRFTDAETHEVYQAPVLQHYQAMSDTHYPKYYRNPRTIAVAMSLHPRLGSDEDNLIGSLGCDVVAKIARMML